MMDIAKILSQHNNVHVTIVTTPQNASRFSSILARYLDIQKVQYSKNFFCWTQTVLGLKDEAWKKFNEDMLEAEMATYGILMNSFEELEPTYAREYKKVRNGKAWCIGPVSLSNSDYLDKFQRGNNNKVNSSGEWKHLKWLDSQKQGSVIYACLGSLCNLTSTQMIELCLALEATKRPFIWVIREGNQLEELKKWIEESGFEGRINVMELDKESVFHFGYNRLCVQCIWGPVACSSMKFFFCSVITPSHMKKQRIWSVKD
ncbi:UDP-glycosyltransferase [Trifolium repens]|nr:UDP-glycosyltransferase [Trifolium repens]